MQDRDRRITATAALATTTASLCGEKKIACHDHVQIERDLHSGSWLLLVFQKSDSLYSDSRPSRLRFRFVGKTNEDPGISIDTLL